MRSSFTAWSCPRSRIRLLAALLAAALLVPAAASARAGQDTAPAPERVTRSIVAPDIFVVMVDDLGYLDDERVLERLPAIDGLWLEGGLRFEQMHTETPLCGPSRAVLLTGRHALANGVVGNDGDPMDPTATIATALDEAGYETALLGKYLNHYGGTTTPAGWDHVAMRDSVTVPSYDIDGEMHAYQGRHFDDVLRTLATDWLREAPADVPVFGLVTPRAPHRHPQWCDGPAGERVGCVYLPMPMGVDEGSRACADLAPYHPAGYSTRLRGSRFVPWAMPDWPDGWPLVEVCESMLVVDRMVADLLRIQAGRDRPAWWFFLSDNGMAWGEDAYPLKHVPPASRMPFYAAATGKELEPGDVDALFSNLDIAPTLAELGGARMPWADGLSFAPLLRGEPVAGRDEMLELMVGDDAHTYAGWAALRTPDARYIRWDDGRRQAFDLRRDPDERHDVIGDYPAAKIACLDRQLDGLIADPQGAEDASPGLCAGTAVAHTDTAHRTRVRHGAAGRLTARATRRSSSST